MWLCCVYRFTAEGHIPYINAYENFPEDMKLFGRDALIFRVEVILLVSLDVFEI